MISFYAVVWKLFIVLLIELFVGLSFVHKYQKTYQSGYICIQLEIRKL